MCVRNTYYVVEVEDGLQPISNTNNIESIIITYSLLISALCCDVAPFKVIKKNVDIDTFNTKLGIDFALMLNKMTRFY